MFDDLEGSEKIKVYDRGISVNPSPENLYQMLIGYRTGDMWAPQLAVTEALSAEAAHFVECIQGNTKPTTDGEAGLRVVRLLEAASESMAASGKLVGVGNGNTAGSRRMTTVFSEHGWPRRSVLGSGSWLQAGMVLARSRPRPQAEYMKAGGSSLEVVVPALTSRH
jgi:hypothetical protein